MPKQIGGITVYELKEIHSALNVTMVTLRSYIKQGKMKAQKLGGKWVVTEESLKSFLNGQAV